MSNFEPKLWEGNFHVQRKSAGSDLYTLKATPSGKYSAETVQDALKAILAAKVKLDGWKVWLDGDFDTKLAKGEDVTPAKLAKIIKEADSVMLAYVKRPFPQPKLKFTKGGGKPSATPRPKLDTL
jgi:hypothetical protein